MKIVVAGGRDEADFLIGLLLMGKHKIIAINGDMGYCEHLAASYNAASVIYGDPCKEYVMDEAGVKGYDILIALREKDADNLEICQMAKRLFAIKNVEIFEMLGVDRAISATYMLAHYIEQASVIEDLVRVMPLENQKVLVNEIKVNSDCPVVDRRIADMELPFNTIISCIIRETEVIVPNGQNKIMAGDRLVVITTPQSQKESVKAILGSEDNE